LIFSAVSLVVLNIFRSVGIQDWISSSDNAWEICDWRYHRYS